MNTEEQLALSAMNSKFDKVAALLAQAQKQLDHLAVEFGLDYSDAHSTLSLLRQVAKQHEYDRENLNDFITDMFRD